jgi:conjugative relaxase-like TrwC/TraI family protein
MGKGSALYYVNLAQEQQEYDCTQPGEPPGRWWGAGAKHLGLPHHINRHDFLLLFSGFSPEEESLVRNAGDENRVPGWDFVFAPPPSIGKVLWAVAPPEIRTIIEECHRDAILTSLSYLEQQAYVRRGAGGAEVEKAGLVVAIFPHGTNRNQEPFLHSHCLVLNLAVSQEQDHSGALYSKALYQHKMAAGAIYRGELSALLEQRLGLSLERVQSWFELTGFSRERGAYQELMNLWSSRRQEIEEREPQSAREAQIIAYETRGEKQELPPRTELFEQWQEVGRQYGFGAEQARKLVRDPCDRPTLVQRFSEWRIIREAASRVVRSESHFTRRQLVWRMAEAAQTRGINTQRVLELTEKYLASRQIKHLGVVDREERFTTKRLWKLERQILTQIQKLDRDHSRFRVPSYRLSPLAKQYKLTREQEEAVRRVTSRGRVKALCGISGTGKTHTLTAVREAFEQSGYRVIGVTSSKRGAERLKEQTGIGKQSVLSQALFGKKESTVTVNRLFWELDRAAESRRQYGSRSVVPFPLSSKTVVIVDNAQDVSAVQMKRLVTEVGHSGAKLVLSGDIKQSAAYEHGGAFRASASALKAPELREVKRQETEQERRIVHQIDRGKALTALRTLQEQGRFYVSETREEAIKQVITTWATHGAKRPRDHIILTDEREESLVINRLAQAERQSQGYLKGTGVRIREEQLYRGDRVYFTETSSTYGIAKGTFGEVRHIDRITKVAVVRLDNGKMKAVNLRHYKGVELGYCVPGREARDVEARYAYVLSRGIYGRQGAAVQLSRASVATHVHTYQLERDEEVMVELAHKMSREKVREFAHTVQEQTQEPQRDR